MMTLKELLSWQPLAHEVIRPYFDGLVQEMRYSITKALELRLSCTNS